MIDVPEQLAAHLRRDLGTWPPTEAFTVTKAESRSELAWDGVVRAVAGIRTPHGTILSGADTDDGLVELVFRWTTAPTELEPLGEWRPADDPTLPEWLRPFGGEVLAVFDDDGAYLAGVGLKCHDDFVWEIAVGTEPAARGKGLARRLVATAARAVLDSGRVPTYLHELTNHASAHVAEAAGFPDRGWRYLAQD
ncbi:MAG TPA: GNAT family N-acetyltransferase [Acidimicrobiales bacterium]|nr:GNAT family N-acetyltransferase [Acidimicrobiales bacterium]